ncbi:unnamed protein product [Somion occarium]|uniref:Uncharacterized protein n=1 Tax=Somion occarium TaxID=3059160 RepID=A0ABP1E719_9APHY
MSPNMFIVPCSNSYHGLRGKPSNHDANFETQRVEGTTTTIPPDRRIAAAPSSSGLSISNIQTTTPSITSNIPLNQRDYTSIFCERFFRRISENRPATSTSMTSSKILTLVSFGSEGSKCSVHQLATSPPPKRRLASGQSARPKLAARSFAQGYGVSATSVKVIVLFARRPSPLSKICAFPSPPPTPPTESTPEKNLRKIFKEFDSTTATDKPKPMSKRIFRTPRAIVGFPSSVLVRRSTRYEAPTAPKNLEDKECKKEWVVIPALTFISPPSEIAPSDEISLQAQPVEDTVVEVKEKSPQSTFRDYDLVLLARRAAVLMQIKSRPSKDSTTDIAHEEQQKRVKFTSGLKQALKSMVQPRDMDSKAFEVPVIKALKPLTRTPSIANGNGPRPAGHVALFEELHNRVKAPMPATSDNATDDDPRAFHRAVFAQLFSGEGKTSKRETAEVEDEGEHGGLISPRKIRSKAGEHSDFVNELKNVLKKRAQGSRPIEIGNKEFGSVVTNELKDALDRRRSAVATEVNSKSKECLAQAKSIFPCRKARVWQLGSLCSRRAPSNLERQRMSASSAFHSSLIPIELQRTRRPRGKLMVSEQ